MELKISSRKFAFYILEDQEKLCILTAELLEYCNAQKSQSRYRPGIGDACCAKYTSKTLLGHLLKGKYCVLFYIGLYGSCYFRCIFG